MIDLARRRDNVAADVEEILRMFPARSKIAVLVRMPGQPMDDFISTDDDLDELIAMLQRHKTLKLAAAL